MTRHYQETMLEFRREATGHEYTSVRGIVVYVYGGDDIADSAQAARKQLGLEKEWKLVSGEKGR